MPGPYSTDLRERVVGALEEGRTLGEVGRQFGVDPITAWRWRHRVRRTGSVQPGKMGGVRTEKLDEAALRVLEELVLEAPDRTRQELADLLAEKTGIRVNPTTIGRALRKLGYSRKKKRLIATERNKPEVQEQRREFGARQQHLDPARLVFVDESGSHIGMTRTDAWARSGTRAIDDVPRNRGTVTTIIGALTIAGLEAVMTLLGSTTGRVFAAFAEQVLAPILQKGDIVVLDNLSPHRDQRALQAIEATGATVAFLPPYSPDLNPIEQCWSKVKSLLRSAKARTRDALDDAIVRAARLVTPIDAAGWFDESGYPLQPA